MERKSFSSALGSAADARAVNSNSAAAHDMASLIQTTSVRIARAPSWVHGAAGEAAATALFGRNTKT
jgi:hypothetical protein